MRGKDGIRIRNIGAVCERWLADIGIHTLADLARIGSVEAYRRIREREPGANIIALYALEGALLDMHWRELPPEVKEALHEQVGWAPKSKPRPGRRGGGGIG
ncbi:TfoX/Sxy family protein [Paenibacillus sp.]|uniref:TfoX/Sxy family protein n=1 Tax=Paenibacillus sp. TaxID=58172 RepID=UPI002D56952B|nr:TfoX/Sxy family protein [Paenibacillus sp.]HZG84196.1 TfoX/Sxy family protein [Paenibacillus sp.]